MNQPTSVTELALREQALESALALPAACYRDLRFFEVERQLVFPDAWQWAGHVSQIPAVGDHLSVLLAHAPVVVIRDAENQIRAYHNVCRHRAGPLVHCDGKGAKVLRCKYHGWTYGLDGVLKSAPEMQTADGFVVDEIRLPELQVGVWEGLIFVAGAQAPEFAAFTDGMSERVGSLSPKDYQFGTRHSYEIDCNWKVYVDNYLEGYHVPHIHPELNRMLDYRSYVTQTHAWHSLQFSPLESSDSLYGNGEALYYFLYPNTMLNVLPGRLQVNRVLPLPNNRCQVDFIYFYPPDDSPEGVARRARDHDFSHLVQEEDIGICVAVQRGLESGSYSAGRINPLRENALHHFHELLRARYREALA